MSIDNSLFDIFDLKHILDNDITIALTALVPIAIQLYIESHNLASMIYNTEIYYNPASMLAAAMKYYYHVFNYDYKAIRRIDTPDHPLMALNCRYTPIDPFTIKTRMSDKLDRSAINLNKFINNSFNLESYFPANNKINVFDLNKPLTSSYVAIVNDIRRNDNDYYYIEFHDTVLVCGIENVLPDYKLQHIPLQDRIHYQGHVIFYLKKTN
jgi:hypothetical protein